MDTIIYIIIGIFIILYIIDKKELVPPEIETMSIKEEIQEKVMTIEEKKTERRNNIYKNILTTLKEENPLKTYRVWTYIEIPNTSRNIQLSYRKMDIPIYFKKCIDLMKKNVPELIILTPLNIIDYLPDFSMEMKHESIVPLKLRIDLLFASILEEYGGLCISPGTILYDVNNALSLLKKYELVTFGGNPSILQSQNHIYYPNSYIIGSQKGTIFIKEYKRYLLMMKEDTSLYNFKVFDDSDIISHLVQKIKPSQYHFGTDYDGTYNSKLQKISLKEYMGATDLDFSDKNKLMVVSVPYDILLKTSQYKWFLDLSEIQFIESNLVLKRLILTDI